MLRFEAGKEVKIQIPFPRICRATLTALVAATMPIALAAQQQPQTPEPGKAATIQITTSSPQARAFFEQGLARMETLHWEAALSKWRDAAQVDPNFALAHA